MRRRITRHGQNATRPPTRRKLEGGGLVNVAMRFSAAVALALTALSYAAPAGAAPSVPVRVRFEAAPGCPSEATFWREVRARSDRIRAAPDDPAASSFEVVLAMGDQAYRGTLTVRRSNAGTTQRELTDANCSELVSALALIAALTVDPEASTRAGPLPEATDPGLPQAPPVPHASTPAGPTSPNMSSARPPPGPRWSVAVGSVLEGTAWLAPEPMLGGRWFAELARHDGAAFRTSFARSSQSDERAELVWATARLEACPLRLGGYVGLRPCAALDAGLLLGTGASSTTTEGLSAWKRWFSANLLARVYVPLLGPLELQADSGLSFPLIRDQFVVESEDLERDRTIHDVPALGAFVALGLGLRFGL